MVIIAALSLMFASCSKSRSMVEEQTEGSVTLAVTTPEVSKSRATVATKLRVRIVNSAGTSVCDTTISIAGETSLITIPKLDQGTAYTAFAWTTDNSGTVIHSEKSTQFDVVTNQITSILLALLPRCGSIMMQLYDVPGTVDSVVLAFASDSGSFRTSKIGTAKMSLELDNVAYGAHGKLDLKMFKGAAVLAEWDTTFTFTNQNISGQFSFLKSGGIETKITMEEPSNTIFSGSGDPTKKLDEESGKLVITEFMANGGSTSSPTTNGEFVEIYNPLTTPFTTDTLQLSAGDKIIKLANITIPAGGFYVVAAGGGSFWTPDTTISTLDLIGTSGLISVSSNGVLHDYVIYFSTTSSGWPALSPATKKSWEIDLVAPTAVLNNFGANWRGCATTKTSADGTLWSGNPRIF